jgi:tRNA dimethylallyltransferase
LLGPTAAGKSDLAMRLAGEWGAAILSVDSMQVYRGMDIGTSKPSKEEQQLVRHYMIDLAEPEETFSVARFQRESRAVIDRAGEQMLLIVGGSGLHFRAVLDPLTFAPHDPEVRRELEEISDPAQALIDVDPAASRAVDLANRRRVVRALEIHRLTGLTPSERLQTTEASALRAYRGLYDFAAVGVDPGNQLKDRIQGRLTVMREAGMLAEVKDLEPRLGPTAAGAVGYRQLVPVVRGQIAEEQGWRDTARATWQLARRQRTYFRRDPRIRWIPWAPDPEERYQAVRSSLEAA